MEKQFPKNVRQIGNVCDEPKIYVEDYVDTYLNQLRQKALDNPAGAVLMGERHEQEGQEVVYILGALQMKELEVNGNDILIREDVWEYIEEEKKEYFPSQEIVGWCLIETGHPMGLNKGVSRIHMKHFAKDNSVFIWKDALEAEEIFYAYKYGELMQMGGHYIYYEKNPAMQNYMINTRRMIGVTPCEMVEDRAAKNFRSAVREKMEYKEQKQNSRFVYAVSVLLVVIVLAIGISTMNNFDKMESVQETLEALSMSVDSAKAAEAESDELDVKDKEEGGKTAEAKQPVDEETDKQEVKETAKQEAKQEVQTMEGEFTEDDFYVVKKGDTLDTISLKIYGNTGHVEAICKMNGLSDGNLIFIGLSEKVNSTCKSKFHTED